MSFRPVIITLIFFILITSSILALDNKNDAKIVKVGNTPVQPLHSIQMLSAADTCFARMDDGLVWLINGWVWGNELYKAYIDPELSCTDPYPFTIIAVNMPMYFEDATPLDVSVDIEEVDNTSYPGCHIPGAPLSISSEYNLAVPDSGGLFDIWIMLDSPVVVNGPFFAGFFISNLIDTAVHTAVITDDNPPDSCACFNVWDLAVGLVDLNNNPYCPFPGRLVLYAAGIPGGDSSLTQPDPAVMLLSPDMGDTLFESIEIWAADTSGSEIIEYVTFAYAEGGIGGPYYELGRDYDGTTTLRDGVNPATVNHGYKYTWDFSAITEGQYTIRAAAFDTQGDFSMDYRTVYLEPTPPLPIITSPDEGTDFCTSLDLTMVCNDENISLVEITRHIASLDYSVGLATLAQNSLGDDNGNPDDGNYAVNNEFGDYYCAPVAAAIAANLWNDRGYTSVLTDTSGAIDIETLAENLAAEFKTRENLGTYDDDLYVGLKKYFAANGDDLDIDYLKNPNYFDLRRWLEDEQSSVIIGLSGDPGLWLALDGFEGWLRQDSSYYIKVSDPLSGTLVTYALRDRTGYSEVYIDGNWQTIDIMVSFIARDWSVTQTLLGLDMDGANGWSYSWAPVGIEEDSLSYFRARTKDATNIRGYDAALFRYSCSEDYVKGDFTDDGNSDIADLTYLIDFIVKNGPAPVGGAGRADCNCDNYINVADIVYYMNFLFGSSNVPCY